MTFEYDVRGVEPGQDFSTPVPNALYKFRVADAAEEQSKSSGNDMIKLELEIHSGEYKGRKVWDYVVFAESTDWKVRQFVDAFGLKEKGKVSAKKLIGEFVMGKTKTEGSPDDEYGVQSKIAQLLPLPEDEEEAEEEDEEGTEEDLTWDDLQEYDRAELKTLIKDEELGIRVTKGKSDDDLREAIAEALEIETEEAEEEEEDEEEGEDYSEMSLSELKSECKDRELSTSGTKKALIKRLEENDNDDEPF